MDIQRTKDILLPNIYVFICVCVRACVKEVRISLQCSDRCTAV